MRLEKGVQNFTTGVPNRNYSNVFDYHHPSRSFSRRQTTTSSNSSPTVIACLVLEDRNFFNRFAIKNRDGTYRTKDSKSLTREQINELHKDSLTMRSIVYLLSVKERYRSDLIAHSVRDLGLDEYTAKIDICYLIAEGVIGYRQLGKLSANKNAFDSTVFSTNIDPFAKMRTKKKISREKAMLCSF